MLHVAFILVFLTPYCAGQNGRWTEIAAGCIGSNNHWVGTVSSLAECQTTCESQTDFNCLSVGYKDGTCKHSRYNRKSITPSSDFSQPCYNGDDAWLYTERLDKDYYWINTVGGCIRGNNAWAGSVASFETCQERCLSETSFACLSIEYKDRSCHLSTFNRNTIRPTSDFAQPCYISGFSYAERVDVGSWTMVVDACIRGHNISSVSVPDLDACRVICSQSDRCCSINYKDGNCHLSSNNIANVCPRNDYTEPCYALGWQYTERMDVKCPNE